MFAPQTFWTVIGIAIPFYSKTTVLTYKIFNCSLKLFRHLLSGHLVWSQLFCSDESPQRRSRTHLARLAELDMAPAFKSRRKQSSLLACLLHSLRSFGALRFELRLHAPKACMLPLHHAPFGNTRYTSIENIGSKHFYKIFSTRSIFAFLVSKSSLTVNKSHWYSPAIFFSATYVSTMRAILFNFQG